MQYFQTLLITCSVLGFLLLSCASIQTQPTCKVEAYGIVDFVNHTGATKYATYCLIDNDIECKLRLFDIPPKYPPTRIRLQPGTYQIGLRLLEDYEYTFKAYEIQVEECKVTVFTFGLQYTP